MHRAIRLLPVLLAAVLAAPAARAASFAVCPSGDRVYYYMFTGTGASESLQFEYLRTSDTAPGGLTFDDGSGPHHRTVHETKGEILRAVCSSMAPGFESANGLGSTTRIGGPASELFEVELGGVRVGTVFKDTSLPFASGGGLAAQGYYAGCTGIDRPVLNSVAAFHTGFDTPAINGVSASTAETEYLAPARMHLAEAAQGHMLAECTTVLTLQDFLLESAGGTDYEVHYDVVDPPYGVVAVWDN